MLIKVWHLNKKLKTTLYDTSWKEDLSIDIIFGPCYFSWDTPFKMWLGMVKNRLVYLRCSGRGQDVVSVIRMWLVLLKCGKYD